MRVHLVGIGGAALSALAHLYVERGDTVTGSDARASSTTDELVREGAFVAIGHSADNVGDAELVVTSTAVPADNPELVEATRKRIRIVHRSRAVAELVSGLRQVAIAGTHGKTTTTTMVAGVLAGLDPMVLSGGRLPDSQFNSRSGRGRLAVIEADESDGSFLELSPEIGVVTNVEADHLDRYTDLAAIEAAFDRFAAGTSGALVACVDDPGAARLLAASAGEVVGYGFGPAEVHASEYEVVEGGSAFLLASPWGDADVSLPVPGLHNVRNALAAAAVGLRLGVPIASVVSRLAGVRLPGRRLELAGEINGAAVYDDYGHHPTEVRATLEAARQLGGGRLVCAFQPHRYSRLQAFMDEFATSFDGADQLLLLPVYAAGEAPIDGISSAFLAQAVRRRDLVPVTVLAQNQDLTEALQAVLQPGDVCVCMGAGDINTATREAIESARPRPDDAEVAAARAAAGGNAEVVTAVGQPRVLLPQADLAWLDREPGVRAMEILAGHCTYRIGGPAQRYLEVGDSKAAAGSLAGVLARCAERGVPVTPLGNGSNLLIADEGVPGLVVRLLGASVTVAGHRLEAEAGARMVKVAQAAEKAGLTGMEWALGIPGTVGGSVYNNAGCFGSDIAATVAEVSTWDPAGMPWTLGRADLGFVYRGSAIRAGEFAGHIVGGVGFDLVPGDPAAIRAAMAEVQQTRKRTQPVSGRSTGSVFKNPPGDHAGRLVDSLGLKGHRVGGAMVSAEHGNFIVNTGTATAADVLTLVSQVRARVLTETGVDLELEMEMLGAWPYGLKELVDAVGGARPAR